MKKEKTEYEPAVLKLVLLNCPDVITASSDMEFGDGSETPSDGWT